MKPRKTRTINNESKKPRKKTRIMKPHKIRIINNESKKPRKEIRTRKKTGKTKNRAYRAKIRISVRGKSVRERRNIRNTKKTSLQDRIRTNL